MGPVIKVRDYRRAPWAAPIVAVYRNRHISHPVIVQFCPIEYFCIWYISKISDYLTAD